jgi:hypothetical protein
MGNGASGGKLARATIIEAGMKISRRKFVELSGQRSLAQVVSGRAEAASIRDMTENWRRCTLLAPENGQAYRPVVTLNGWTLPWHERDGRNSISWQSRWCANSRPG